MRKIILTLGLVLGASTLSFAQFSEMGYKDLKLGMNAELGKKTGKVVMSDGETGVADYNGAKLTLWFYPLEGEEVLFGIQSDDVNARLEGVKEQVIGKKQEEVKKILGKKMVLFDEGFDDNVYVFYSNGKTNNDSMTLCLLIFDDSKTLESIVATYRP